MDNHSVAFRFWLDLKRKFRITDPALSHEGIILQIKVLLDEVAAESTNLRKALQEFDSFYSIALKGFTDGWESRQSDDCVVWGWNDATLTIGMFRRARVALGNMVEGNTKNIQDSPFPWYGFETDFFDKEKTAEQERQAVVKKAPTASPTIEELLTAVLQQVIDEGRATQFIEDIGRYKEALHDILHGPVGVTDLKQYIHSLEQIAHDALYGPDDTAHVGNWKAVEEKENIQDLPFPWYAFETDFDKETTDEQH